MGDITERTKLLEKERENSLGRESYELANQRDSRSCETPSANERSADEIGINTALEPALGRKTWKGYLILILTPLVLCPLPIFLPSMASRAGYGILIIVVYWVTEVCPLAVTSMLPLVIFPLLGVLSSSDAAEAYFQNANVLFLGGLLVFVSFEEWNLHKRIALKVLLLIGTKKQNLLLGFMLATAGISMLLSNTATTAMMIQIVKVVLNKLESCDTRQVESISRNYHDSDECPIEQNDRVNREALSVPQNQESALYHSETVDRNAGRTDVANEGEGLEEHARQDEQKQFATALLLATAMSANIGGVGTLTGTGTNIIFAGQALRLFPKSGGVSFASWFAFAFPLMVILLLVAWVYLVILFLGAKSAISCFSRKPDQSSRIVYQIIKDEYDSLGKMSFAEIAVMGHLVVLVLLWLTKDPKFMPGWGTLFREGYVSDGAVAMLVAFSLFQFPSMMKNKHARVYSGRLALLSSRPLLDLQMVSEKLCWNVLVLLGAGFAIAAACKNSGLSTMISGGLQVLEGVPDYAIVSVICLTTTAVTEILSNTGTATIFLPVLASLAVSTHIHPWYLMIPATISCSFAFMFPVSTPANAIVYSSGRIKMWDMVRTGVGMDIICLAILLIFSNLYGSFYFHFKTFPNWAYSYQLISTLSPTNITTFH